MDVLATVIGATLAGAFGLTAVWLRWFMDRPLLKVRAHLGRFVQAIPEDQTWYIFLEAINPHNKPVTVSTFGFALKSKAHQDIYVIQQLGYQFPYEIAGGKSLSQWTDVNGLFELLQKDDTKPSDLKWVWFDSSSGKRFQNRVSKLTIRQLEKLFAAYVSTRTEADKQG